jgi:predicted RNase H-like HicB family nuclease
MKSNLNMYEAIEIYIQGLIEDKLPIQKIIRS